MIKLNTEYVKDFITDTEISNMQPVVKTLNDMINNKTGAGNDFLGWLDLASTMDVSLINDINNAAKKIREQSDVLLVIGIGGSYLGARAVIELLTNPFNKDGLEVIFIGQNMSATYLNQVADYIKDKDYSINVISKSGTTLEPALAFRHFKDLLVEKYGEGANERIYATTDKAKGALKPQADANNWVSFVVPDDVGGRFSVLTPVGLLPIAAAGIDIQTLINGAIKGEELYKNVNINENDAYKYAVIRQQLYKKGYTTEMLVGYEPSLSMFIEWWKQLFAESEGKDNQGIFPVAGIFSTDLHSVGQYIQSGRRDLMETIIDVKNPQSDITIKEDAKNLDQLNYLTGKTINFANNCAFRATAEAHVDGGVPNMIIEIDQLDEENLGQLIYFFEKAVAMSGYLAGINPFDQPGVENYKKRMFKLLGKPE